MESFTEWWMENVKLECNLIDIMEKLIKLICLVLFILSLAIFTSAIIENKLSNRVEKLEKALIQSKKEPQKLEIKYIK